MKRFVYKENYAKLLVRMIDQKYKIEKLAKEIDVNSGHLRIVIDQWHKEDVIRKSRNGRDYIVELTKKGRLIAEKLCELMDLVDNYNYEIEPEELQKIEGTKGGQEDDAEQ